MSEINLDDATIYESLDPSGMFGCLREMPEQCRRAWELSESFKIPPDYSRAKKIVVLGMGGSAIGGDLVSSLVSADCTAPVITCRGYDLPAFVERLTATVERALGSPEFDERGIIDIGPDESPGSGDLMGYARAESPGIDDRRLFSEALHF